LKLKRRLNKKNGRASYEVSCRRTKLEQAEKGGHAVEHGRWGEDDKPEI